MDGDLYLTLIVTDLIRPRQSNFVRNRLCPLEYFGVRLQEQGTPPTLS